MMSMYNESLFLNNKTTLTFWSEKNRQKSFDVALFFSFDRKKEKHFYVPTFVFGAERKSRHFAPFFFQKRKAFLVATAAMVIFGGTVGGTIYGIGTLTGVTNDNSLKFERVAFEELLHGSGGKVVRVRGTIRNPGSTPADIPGVSIVLRSANGNEITRWKHISRTLRLQPGETTHFVSAKPLDYSIVSSVDAQFDCQLFTYGNAERV